jgi:hypothetical protein
MDSEKGLCPEREKMFTLFGTNLEKGHVDALLELEQSLIYVCPEQDDGNRMAVR